MKTLGRKIKPTPEQVGILSEGSAGPRIIRGAAGSGKTTTAILRLRSLIGSFKNRRNRLGSSEPVRALVLTFNRTLRGYVREIVSSQLTTPSEIDLEIATFGSLAFERTGRPRIVDDTRRSREIRRLGAGISLPAEFVEREVDYLLGRFVPEDRDRYLTARRLGRGISPRVDLGTRTRLLLDVVKPYEVWKATNQLIDWHDLAFRLSEIQNQPQYDIIIADECQDYSANQLKSLKVGASTPKEVTACLGKPATTSSSTSESGEASILTYRAKSGGVDQTYRLTFMQGVLRHIEKTGAMK